MVAWYAYLALQSCRTEQRILVVDDSVDVVESLRYALTMQGYPVEVAYDAVQALQLAHAFRPDVILCDLALPRIDGYALARQLRADPQLRDACLVAISGYSRPADIARSKEAGFDHHLVKPPALDELQVILESALTRPRS